jgi:hypothetical protein
MPDRGFVVGMTVTGVCLCDRRKHDPDFRNWPVGNASRSSIKSSINQHLPITAKHDFPPLDHL